MAGRPQSYCRDCGRQWFVTAHAPAARCPGCSGPRVEAVLSLDDAEPAPPPAYGSALPLLLGLGVLGMALLGASGVAVYLLWDRPPPRQAEHAAAPTPAPAPRPPTSPTVGTPAPPTAPPAAPAKESEPADPPAKTAEPVARPNESGRTAPAPDAAALTPRPAPTPVPTPAPPAPMADALTPGAATPKQPPGGQPRPRPAHPFPAPSGGWESPWEKLGDVRVRVCGVAVANMPVERRKQESMSKDRYFVVWLDIENVSATAYTYRRWQPVLTGECTLKYASGAAISYANYPPETGRLWFADFNQPIPPGGPPLLESLAFARPDINTPGDLTLTLDASRVGGTGRYSLTIPHGVWARP